MEKIIFSILHVESLVLCWPLDLNDGLILTMTPYPTTKSFAVDYLIPIYWSSSLFIVRLVIQPVVTIETTRRILKRVAGSAWMAKTWDRVLWRTLGEAYVQQWTAIGWWWWWHRVLEGMVLRNRLIVPSAVVSQAYIHVGLVKDVAVDSTATSF